MERLQQRQKKQLVLSVDTPNDTNKTNMSKKECSVCGEPIPEEYGKHDPKAPVHADDYVYHLSCEDAVFEEVFNEV